MRKEKFGSREHGAARIVVFSTSLILAGIITIMIIAGFFAMYFRGHLSNLEVHVAASGVSADVSGGYIMLGDKDYESFGEASLTGDEEQVENFSHKGIQIRKKKPQAIFKYTFTNNSEESKIQLTTNFSGEAKNLVSSIAYATSEIETNKLKTIIGSEIDTAVIDFNKTAYVYVRLSIAGNSAWGSFEGNIEFNLFGAEKSAEVSEEQGILKVGEVVERGEYPQSFVGKTLNDKLVKLYNENKLKATQKTYRTEIEAKTVICPEYEYEGERYVLVESAVFYGDGGTFSTGETYGWFVDKEPHYFGMYKGGEQLFFKVEPIKFVVKEFDENTMTLETQVAIGSIDFSDSIWEGSNLERYLNSDFIADAELGDYLIETTVPNNVPDDYYDDTKGNPTIDKVWIASVADLRRWYPEQNIQVDTQDPLMYRPPSYQGTFKSASDFAYSTRTPKGRDFYANGRVWPAVCSYLLRSAGHAFSFGVVNCSISEIGSVHNRGCYPRGSGICPIIKTYL